MSCNATPQRKHSLVLLGRNLSVSVMVTGYSCWSVFAFLYATFRNPKATKNISRFCQYHLVRCFRRIERLRNGQPELSDGPWQCLLQLHLITENRTKIVFRFFNRPDGPIVDLRRCMTSLAHVTMIMTTLGKRALSTASFS